MLRSISSIMKSRPVILITAAREPDASNHGIDMLRLHKSYSDCVAAAGGLPFIPTYVEGEIEYIVQFADGLLLSGGRDVEPERMGCVREIKCGDTDEWRDRFEWDLLSAFVKHKKPVFGICRGLQVINAFFGGTVIQDIPSKYGISHKDTIHTVTVKSGCFLDHLFSRSFTVNSVHHQSIDVVGEGLDVVAWDGAVVEGVCHRNLPVSAVQWHPERMSGCKRFNSEGTNMMPLFLWWIQQVVEFSRK